MKPFLLFVVSLVVFFSTGYAQSPKYFVGMGEYQNFIIDNTAHTLWSLGTGAGKGTGSNTLNAGYATLAQFPNANTQIKFVASGLHTAAAVDMSGNVYFAGGNEDGSMGNGTTTGSAASFVQVTTDSLGNAFTNVNYIAMGSSIFTGGQGYGACIFAVKNDGTLWVWGNTQGGYRGNGTYGMVNTRPVQVPFPAGTVITKVLISNTALALDAAGNVWTWAGNGPNDCLLGSTSRTDYEDPQKVSLPGPAKDIAGGGMWSYALLQSGSLYGWGLYQGYMGVGATAGEGWANTPAPLLLDNQLNLQAPISQITSNRTSTYVILTNGTLWAWGGNECGQIGEGTELNYGIYTVNPAPYGGTTPAPYAWDWNLSAAELQQHKPIQVAAGINNFVGLGQGQETVFYQFAVDANGKIYSWGRNKAGVLGNGVMDGDYTNGAIAADYPNSFDVPYITAINPFQTGTIQSTSPECLTNPNATGCSVYAIPANTKPVANPGANQNITGSTTTLDGTGSTDNVFISYYLWTQVSGPSTAQIVIPSGAKATVNSLVTGVYKFQLRCIDNGWLRDSAVVTVTVNNGGPTANAGSNQTITLPTNSVTLSGSATETSGTIASYAWTQVSGPSTATFTNASSATATAGGLVQGTYTFKLTATDGSGVAGSATVTVTVNAAPSAPVSNAGSNQTITLPTNSATLTGSGSETNGTISSFGWTQVSGPSTATFTTASVAQTGVTGLVQGVYTFELTILDILGIKATATVQVTVNAPVPGPPSANAGSAQTITLPTNSATLSGSGSETNGTIVSYAWTELSGPSTATIASGDQAQTSVTGLVQGVYSFQLTVTDNSGKTATDAVKVTVNAAPAPPVPVANAGTDQTITLPTNSVTLSGSGSETNGTIVSYAWTELSGPSTATIASGDQAQTSVTGLVQGVYSFQLTVTDNSGVKATDAMKVTVNSPTPGAPVANAGADQTITLPTNSVTLSGSGSEANGTIVGYAWTETSGPSAATIASAGQAQTGVTSLVQGVYTFQLTITDNSGNTATDVIKVTVNAAVIPPVPEANAGADQTITLPTNSVTLSGSGSETNGTIVSYAWTETSGPSTATIASGSTAQTSVTGLVQGVYTFQLTVKDNSGNTATDVAKVTVSAAPAPPVPVANAGADQTITLPTNSVTLSGSGSETNGTIVSYAWTETSGPSTATIASGSAAQTSVAGLVQGVYTFQLTVKDNSGNTATDVAKVTVNAAVAGPPSADAGSAQTITLPLNSVTLSGSGSETNGTITGYSWTQVSGPSQATIGSASSATASAGELVQGSYVFKLTVTDNSGVTANATVTVTVNPAPHLPPVAVPGPDQTVPQNVPSVDLNGSSSYSPDGTIVSYDWSQVSGLGGVTITNSNTATPSLYGMQPGVYSFQLTVTDNEGLTASANITITVTAVTTAALVANAGITDTVHLPGNQATLNGTSSTVSSGNIVGYSWQQVSGPSTTTISDSTNSTATVTGFQVGTYVYMLTVTDNNGNTATSTVSVVVVPDERRFTNNVSIYPNPVQSMLYVQYQSTGQEQFTITIYNEVGVTEQKSEYEQEGGASTYTLNVSALARGVYVLVIRSSSGQRVINKFVKQ